MGEGTIRRAADLLALGVQWIDMEPVAASAGDPPTVQAGPMGGRLLVTVPPQHIAEEPVSWPWWDCQWKALGSHAVPPGSAVTTLMRDRARIDIFVVDDDGHVCADHWRAGSEEWWGSGWLTDAFAWHVFADRTFPRQRIAAVSPDGHMVSLFGVDTTGTLCTLRSRDDGGWTVWAPLAGDGSAGGFRRWGAAVAAVAQHGVTRVFATRESGQLAHWVDAGGWQPGPDRVFAVDAPVIVPADDRLFALSIDPTGRVLCDVHDGGAWSVVDLGVTEPGQSARQLGAVAVSDNELIVFSISRDGGLFGRYWNALAQTPGSWGRLASGLEPEGSITGVRADEMMPALALAVDPDGLVQAVSVWLEGTGFHVETGSYPDWFPPGGRVSAVYRDDRNVDMFAVSADHSVRTTPWVGPDPLDPPEPVRRFMARAARLAGPSRLAFRIRPGAQVALTAEGVLEAMRTADLEPAAADLSQGAAGTSIELPWGLFMAPAEPTRLEHATRPTVSENLVVETWHTRVGPTAGRRSRDGLPLHHVAPPRRDSGFVPPLTEHDRDRIYDHRTDQDDHRVVTDRLVLGALGGWLTAKAAWADFEWEHEAACGRDLRVRTVEHGVLYPLGHLADYEVVTERRFDPRSDHSVAVLHKQATLYVRQPLRRYADADTRAWREFPFHEVEFATTVVEHLDPPVWGKGKRHASLQSVEDEIQRLDEIMHTNPSFNEEVWNRLTFLRNKLAELQTWAAREVDVFFTPSAAGVPIQLSVWLRGGGEDVRIRMPQIFVAHVVQQEETPDLGLNEPVVLPHFDAFTDRDVQKAVATAFEGHGRVDVGGVPVVLAGGQPFETQALQLAGVPEEGTGFRPLIAGATIGLPSVRRLTDQEQSYNVGFDAGYAEAGRTDVLLRIQQGSNTIDVALGDKSDRAGGLATPSFAADALSGVGEPLPPDLPDRRDLFDPGAKLLGIVSLREVLGAAADLQPPSITSEPQAMGVPPAVTFSWPPAIRAGATPRPGSPPRGIELSKSLPFKPIEGRKSLLTLTVTSVAVAGGPPRVTAEGTLTSFELVFAGVLIVRFDGLKFESRPGEMPTLTIDGLEVEFDGDLRFLDVLHDAVAALGRDLPAAIEATPKEITVHQHVALKRISLGAGVFAVTISGAAFDTTLRLPFAGGMSVAFSFGTRKHPFNVGLWILGGGGYLELGINGDGKLDRLAAAVEIGGLWSIDWGVVAGEIHALAGLEIRLVDEQARLSGYVRIGGTVEVLGIVSVSLELTAEVTAGDFGPDDRFQVTASASLVIEVDLFLLSTDVKLDKTIVLYTAPRPEPTLRADGESAADDGFGGFLAARLASGSQPQISPDDARSAWLQYRSVYAVGPPA